MFFWSLSLIVFACPSSLHLLIVHLPILNPWAPISASSDSLAQLQRSLCSNGVFRPRSCGNVNCRPVQLEFCRHLFVRTIAQHRFQVALEINTIEPYFSDECLCWNMQKERLSMTRFHTFLCRFSLMEGQEYGKLQFRCCKIFWKPLCQGPQQILYKNSWKDLVHTKPYKTILVIQFKHA